LISSSHSYKFGLEYFNGAFITLANERFPAKERYQKIGILTGTNAAMQCVGSILIAPLMKRFPTRTVLSYAVLTFGLISMTLLIADAATGGKPKIMNGGKTKYGTWNPNGLFPIYIISGVAYGMVELIRRVIPRNIVAGDVQRVSEGVLVTCSWTGLTDSRSFAAPNDGRYRARK
jgi:MFS family permease